MKIRKEGMNMISRNYLAAMTVLIIMGWAGNTSLQAQQANLPPEVISYADTVLYNGKILTADEKFSVVQAVAVRDGRFLAVGNSDRILAMAGPNTRRIDLRGKTVTPGIMDLHNHPYSQGVYDFWRDKWLPNEPPWKTPEQAMEGLKRAVARAKPGEAVIIGREGLHPGSGEDSEVGGREGTICDVLTLEQLDSVSPDNPVFFVVGSNLSTWAMNSKAASVSQRFLPKGVSSPFLTEGECWVVKGAERDGVLPAGAQAGNDYIYWAETVDERLPLYRATQRDANFWGVTLVKEHMGVPLFNGVHALWERGEMTLRFRMPFPMTPQISGHTVEVPGEEAEMLFRRWPNMSRIGDPMLRIVGIRVPAVGGSPRGGDVWTLEPKIRPFPDRSGNPAPYGGRMEEQEAVEKGLKDTFRGREVLIQGVRFGWDVAADHTSGDRAYREVIKAFEEALQGPIYYKRPNQRLTTNHTQMAHIDDIQKAAKLGVRSSISSGRVLSTSQVGARFKPLDLALHQYGTERVHKMFPIKSHLTAGGHPTLESTGWELGSDPGDERSAFFWISKAITRRDEVYRRQWNPSEALSRQEALWACTLWSAMQLVEEKDLGSIEVGKLADLVILDRDYMTIPEDDIERIKVLLTMVGGKVVYEVAGGLK